MRKEGQPIPYAILRFEKHQGGNARAIESHHERLKEHYASNPDIDHSRTGQNFHIVKPERNYKLEMDGRIEAAKCPTRKDSIRYVDTLITASPAFFEDKSAEDVRGFFQEAVEFMKEEIGEGNIFSAVVHMDEATPHMHLCFTPITRDNRLTAKEILGNKKKMSQWQDKYYAYMVRKFPDLERGKSASETGRIHIPPQLYKKATHLDEQMECIQQSLDEIKITNVPKKREEIQRELAVLVPEAEDFSTALKSYDSGIRSLQNENARLAGLVQRQEDTGMEIFLLKKKLEKYEKELEKLPPELRALLDVAPPKKEHKHMR